MEFVGCSAALGRLSFLKAEDCCASCHNEPDECYPQCSSKYQGDAFETCCGLSEKIKAQPSAPHEAKGWVKRNQMLKVTNYVTLGIH